MEKIRKPYPYEKEFLSLLIGKANAEIPHTVLENLFVQSMDDGGMGSLRLFPNGITKENPVYGNQISEYIFEDADGIKVIASLNVDSEGNLFELDIWKTDYSPVLRFKNA